MAIATTVIATTAQTYSAIVVYFLFQSIFMVVPHNIEYIIYEISTKCKRDAKIACIARRPLLQ